MSTLTQEHMDMITCRITVRIAQAIKNRELSDDELPEVCHFVLVAVETIRESADMRTFLETLSRRWPIFAQVTRELAPELPAA